MVDFKEGQVLLIDKPLHWTSFDVVNKLRYTLKHALKVKKIKVGHAGTLDPLATGLLVICTGKFTKKIDGLQSDDKVYTGEITLGSTTPSYDLESEVDGTYETAHITNDLMEEARKSFLGTQLQMPPIYSAKKVDGKVAYLVARKGGEVNLKPAEVHIHSLELDSSNFPKVKFAVHCSKGTYIRSLAHDLGKRLSSGAHLSALRRTRSGEFDIANALQIDEAVTYIREHATDISI